MGFLAIALELNSRPLPYQLGLRLHLYNKAKIVLIRVLQAVDNTKRHYGLQPLSLYSI
jgi:hypothetical protein